MSTYVLSTHGNRHSAGKLAAALGAQLVYRECEIPRVDTTQVVRWGNSRNCCADEFFGDFPRVLNSAAGISRCVNKGAALRTVHEGGLAKVPPHYLSGEIIQTTTPMRGLYDDRRWIRRPNRHSRGSGFEEIELRPNERVGSGYHIVKRLEFEKEYRIWVCASPNGGPIKLLTARRIPLRSAGQGSGDPYRSQWGYAFVDTSANQRTFASYVFNGLSDGGHQLAFCAIDCALVPDVGYFFFEANTAPALDHEAVIRFFSRNVAALLEMDYVT